MSEDRRILVPVADSGTVRNTVAHVVRAAAERAVDGDEKPAVHFVSPVSWRRRDPNADIVAEAEEFLDRVETWVDEDLDVEESEERPIAVTTAVVGTDDFLFSPQDYAEVLLGYAREQGLEHIVLDPEYSPGTRAPLLSSLDAELDRADDVTHETAPVQRQIRRRQLRRRAVDLNRFVALFVVAFLFYQILGGFAGPFDYVTGAISAAIVAAVLSGIVFESAIRPVRTLRVLGRWLLYLPYLFWEIARANIVVAYIVLHPSLPIDPSMERVRPAVPPGLPVTTLANSITLTPGTVTVDVRGREFYVHALTEASRDGLYDGGLERAVRYVFFGRAAARIPTLRERGQTSSRVDDDTDTDDEHGETDPPVDDEHREGGEDQR